MPRSVPRRRTCQGLPDRPCFAPLTGGNAQKRCPPCAEEADRRQRVPQNSTYYQKNRPRILAVANRRYRAEVEAERLVLRRYADFKGWTELLLPGREVPSLEEWRSRGMADKPGISERIAKPESHSKGDTGS